MTEFEEQFIEKLDKIGNGLEHIADMISFYNEKLFFNEKGLFVTLNTDEHIPICGSFDANVSVSK